MFGLCFGIHYGTHSLGGELLSLQVFSQTGIIPHSGSERYFCTIVCIYSNEQQATCQHPHGKFSSLFSVRMLDYLKKKKSLPNKSGENKKVKYQGKVFHIWRDGNNTSQPQEKQ